MTSHFIAVYNILFSWMLSLFSYIAITILFPMLLAMWTTKTLCRSKAVISDLAKWFGMQHMVRQGGLIIIEIGMGSELQICVPVITAVFQ